MSVFASQFIINVEVMLYVPGMDSSIGVEDVACDFAVSVNDDLVRLSAEAPGGPSVTLFITPGDLRRMADALRPA